MKQDLRKSQRSFFRPPRLAFVLVAAMGAVLSCEKKEARVECADASCCHPEFNTYIEYIEDFPVLLVGPPQFSNIGFILSEGLPSTAPEGIKARTMEICIGSIDKIKGLSPDLYDPSKLTYTYRVSGKLLADEKNPRLTSLAVLYIYIDKIERVDP